MSEFRSAVDRLLAGAQEVDSPSELQPLGQAVLALLPIASPKELDEAVKSLIGAIDPEHAEASGWLAITAGSIIEEGTDPSALANLFIEFLPVVIQRATAFGEFALTHALSPEASQEIEDDSGGEWLGDRFLPPEQVSVIANEQPDGADAWAAIWLWFMPAVACFTRDLHLRKQAIASLPPVQRLSELNGHAQCLSVLLSVLDDEPFLVFHPATDQGYRMRVSGVADNFQLHLLLADTLIQPSAWLPRTATGLPGVRPHPVVASIARGDGPQESDVTSYGVWDLYNWTALLTNGRLPAEVPTEHWIWGEGIPADIEQFGEFRVVLLGPPSYPRFWNTARYFGALRASIVVEEAFSASDTRDWLRQLGTAVGRS